MNSTPLEDYIEAHISPEPPRLTRLYRDTHLHHLYPRMCSGHLQGRIIKMLTTMIAPKRVLELGAFTGYSAMCIAEGMPEGAELHTVEIDDEMADELQALFDESSRASDITLHIGDAEEIVPQLPGEWDMVFIDANKRRYPAYLNMILPRLAKGGYILADNTLWDGKVIEAPTHSDPQLQGILEFNRMVAEDPTLEKVILPLRDGLTLIRRLP
ncbi:MAG: O-methyltransferase [Bacteroides sp.]|nr:O-methyltransferase [Bacteroides sp.]